MSQAAGFEVFRVEDVTLDVYRAILKDESRPPSRGGNTRAWHQHILTIDGERYPFLALGARKWVFAGDRVSFEWSWDASHRYRNVDPNSIRVRDKTGKPVVRGNRGGKKWRTAETRLPARRRDWKD